MDWQKCMNQAIDYIENNLSDEIDYSVAAQCMNYHGLTAARPHMKAIGQSFLPYQRRKPPP